MNINHIEYTQIKGIIAKSTISTMDELRMLNELVVNTMRSKRSMEAALKKIELSVGMVVKVNHPKLKGKEAVIKNIGRTKVTLSILNGLGSYIVPISLIEY